MIREEWRKLEKESYLKIVNNEKSNQSSSQNTTNSGASNKKAVKASDMIKKRPEMEDSSADETENETETENTENQAATSSKNMASKQGKTSVPASTLSKKKKLRRSRKNSDRSTVTTSLLDLKPGDKVCFIVY